MKAEQAKPNPRRRVDPERRRRIARAALRVVAERGVEALTHRAAASEADVPLGSTTYHFADREELLQAALEEAVSDARETLESWIDSLPAEPDLAARLAALIVTTTGEEREGSMVGFELYIAALRHPRLRPVATEWNRVMPSLLERYVARTTAFALTASVEGLLLRRLIEQPPPDQDAVEAALRAIVRG